METPLSHSAACNFSQSRLFTVECNEFRVPVSPTARSAAAGNLSSAGRFAFQGGPDSAHRNVFVIGSVLVTYWKTGETLLLYCAIAVAAGRVRTRLMMRAYLRARETVNTAEIARRWEYRYVAGASASVALLGMWCLHRLLADARSLRASGQLFNDNRVYGRHIRPKLCKRPICDRADFMRVGADDGGVALYGNGFHWILRRSSFRSFYGIKLDSGKIAPHAARRGDHLTRHVAARQAVRHRDSTTCRTVCACSIPIVTSSSPIKNWTIKWDWLPDLELKGISVRDLVESVVKAGLLSDSAPKSWSSIWMRAFPVATSLRSRLDLSTGKRSSSPCSRWKTAAWSRSSKNHRAQGGRGQDQSLGAVRRATGLPNRTVLRDRMDMALAEWRPTICARYTSSTSTSSSRSTTRWATPEATCCWKRSPSA